MKAIYWASGLAAAAFGGYTAYWFGTAAGVESGLVQWMEDQRRAGVQIEHSGLETKGFPLSLTVAVNKPIVSQGVEEADWAWSSTRIEAAAGLFGLDEPVIDAIGPHRLLVSRGVMTGDWLVTTERLVVRPSLSTDGVTQVEALVQDGVAAEQIDGDTYAAKTITLSLRPQQSDDGDQDLIHVSASADDVTLPPRASGPLGPSVDKATLVGTVQGPVPSRFDAKQLTTWRDAGGTVDVHALNLNWGGVDARAEGTVSLDQQLRPLGALTSRVSGFNTLVDALVEGGVVRRKDSGMIKAVLGLLARRDDEGRKVLKVPVTAQDGMLTMGPIPLLPLPDVTTIARNQGR